MSCRYSTDELLALAHDRHDTASQREREMAADLLETRGINVEVN